ncbi:10524_t:CDS:10, partial [Scutellospora calospora]
EMIQTEVKHEFPETIEGFGYHFNEKGQLRNIKTDERFEFHVKLDDSSYNQTRYERLGEAIGEYIENELVSKFNLKRQIIPLGSDDNTLRSRIYLSEDALECNNLLLIIQGSGVVRPGQWARRGYNISVTLRLGTMYPYIQKAQELNWGIIIFNPNENYDTITKDGEVIECGFIQGSESPQKHSNIVIIYTIFFVAFNSKAKAEKILVMGYSFGGINITCLIDEFADEFKSRVVGIALADSVHSTSMVPSHSKNWFEKYTINWIKSELPLDMKVPQAKNFYGCRCLSAGHPKHEYAAGTAIESIFKYLQHVLDNSNNKESLEQDEESETDKESIKAEEVEKVMEKMEEIEKMKEIEKTEKMEEIGKTKEMEEIEKTEKVEKMEIERPEEMENSDEIEKIEEMKEVEKTEEVKEIEKTEKIEKIEKTEEMEKMKKTEETEDKNELEAQTSPKSI